MQDQAGKFLHIRCTLRRRVCPGALAKATWASRNRNASYVRWTAVMPGIDLKCSVFGFDPPAGCGRVVGFSDK
jgi:hypothetical protein